jgi:hypothetical protein
MRGDGNGLPGDGSGRAIVLAGATWIAVVVVVGVIVAMVRGG